MSDITNQIKGLANQIKGLALYAAKAIVALAAPIIVMFATDALDVLAGGAETALAAAVAAVAVYFVPNRALDR